MTRRKGQKEWSRLDAAITNWLRSDEFDIETGSLHNRRNESRNEVSAYCIQWKVTSMPTRKWENNISTTKSMEK